MKIGFFDSGLGGLIIMKAVAKELPDFDYEYYGDTKNVPYGDKSEEEIYELTKAGVYHLFAKDCALVIVACNTASAETLRKLQDTILIGEYAKRRILGVIIPTVEAVLETKISGGEMIATKRTVESKKYDREFLNRDVDFKLTSTATPKLTPLIEAGRESEALSLVQEHLKEIQSQNVKLLILGCTHYALLKEGLREMVKGEVTIISQDEIIPTKLRSYLNAHPEIADTLSQTGTRNIYLTESRPSYDKIIAHFLGGALIE